MSTAQTSGPSRPSAYIYEKKLPGHEEVLRATRMSSGIELSVDCPSVSGKGSSREEAINALVKLLRRDKMFDPHQVFLSFEDQSEGHHWEIPNKSGQKKTGGLIASKDVLTERVEEWAAYVSIDRLQVPAAPGPQAVSDLFLYAADANVSTGYLNALANGLLDMQEVLRTRFRIES